MWFRDFREGEAFGVRAPDGTLILDQRAADILNGMLEEMRRLDRVSVVPPLTYTSDSAGRSFGISLPRKIMGKLTGTGNPYTFVEQVASGTSWVDAPGAFSGTAYESNGKTGLGGKVVRLKYEAVTNDWRFYWLAYGGAPCSAGNVCGVVISDGCSGGGPVYGATITVKDNASPPTTIGTCTTTGEVTVLTLVSGGSGYTDGTGYALGFSGGGGSGAAGTFDVVGGAVTNLVLTASGSGYSSSPTVSVAAAGAGTGASILATAQGKCCVAIPKSGTYNVTCDLPGASQLSATVNALCSQDNLANFSFPSNSLGTVCFQFQTCTSTSTNNISGATVSITGAGTASGTSDSSGSLCLRLGVGSYSAAITFPSGYTATIPFTVSACTTTNVSLTTYTVVCVSVRTASPAGCTGTITITRTDTGATVGTGTLTTSGATPTGQVCVSITECSTLDYGSWGVGIAFTNWTVAPAGNTTALACYSSSVPFFNDASFEGAPC